MSPRVRALLDLLDPKERQALLERLREEREERDPTTGLPVTQWAGTHRTPRVFR